MTNLHLREKGGEKVTQNINPDDLVWNVLGVTNNSRIEIPESLGSGTTGWLAIREVMEIPDPKNPGHTILLVYTHYRGDFVASRYFATRLKQELGSTGYSVALMLGD